MAEYGDATVELSRDGSVKVARADDAIGVSVELFAQCEPWMYGPDGLFWLDPVGEYRYRPERFATDHPGILICRRITVPAADPAVVIG